MGKYKVTSCVINSNLDEMHVPHYEATVKIELSDLWRAGDFSIDPIEIKDAINGIGHCNISDDRLTLSYPSISFPSFMAIAGRRNGKTHTIETIIKDGFEKLAKRYSISDVIFNDPATIIIWADGSKTVVKCRDGEEFDPEKGLAMAISKKVLGNRYNYYDVFKKYVGRYNKKKFQKALDEAMKITPDEITRNGHRYVLEDHIVEARPRNDTQEAQNKALRDIALNTAKNLRAEGKSLAEIAKIMGYDDPAVVRSILSDEE